MRGWRGGVAVLRDLPGAWARWVADRVRPRSRARPGRLDLSPEEVSEAIRAQGELLAERRRLQEILELIPVSVVLLRPDHRVAFANAFFRERFGEADGKTCFEHLFGRPELCEGCGTARVLEGREPHRWTWLGPDGRHYDCHDFPFIDADGSSLVLKFGVDVTSRRLALASVRQAVSHMRTLFETSLDILVSIREDGSIEDANAACAAATGLSREDLVGKDFASCFAEPAKAREACLKAFALGKARDLPLRIKHQDGRVTPVLYNASVYKKAEDERPGVFAALRDMSEQLAYQDRLVEALGELRRSNAELEQFARIASHDLQEPLRMVGSFTQLLAKRYRGKLDQDADEFIQFAVDGAASMKRVIEDLLSYSRLRAGPRSVRRVDSGEILSESLANLRLAIEESGAVVSREPLPPVRADRNQLLRLFQNLIANALKFKGKRPPHIRVKAERKGPDWVFSVADNGIGLDLKRSRRLFDLRPRLQPGSDSQGSGLGLAICKRIVSSYGGSIWVESEPGRGAVFSFTVPAALEGRAER
ncbi:MAG: PAS domain S-box protein [Elusimicrobia bacterium]|nr:PAS domain S-box protein [Elusimicrobiota bacterium]